MTAQVKSALLLLLVLVFGVLLGLGGRGAFERAQFARAGGPPRGRAGLARHMEETIQPRDSAQAAAIRPVLARAAERNRHIIGNVNDALRASIDSMKAELAPLLDDAQRARLDEVTRALPPVGSPGGGPPGRFGPPGMGGRRGPPPGPPPDQP